MPENPLTADRVIKALLQDPVLAWHVVRGLRILGPWVKDREAERWVRRNPLERDGAVLVGVVPNVRIENAAPVSTPRDWELWINAPDYTSSLRAPHLGNKLQLSRQRDESSVDVMARVDAILVANGFVLLDDPQVLR